MVHAGKITIGVGTGVPHSIAAKANFFRAYVDLVKFCSTFRDRYGKKIEIDIDLPDLEICLGI